MYNKPSRRSVTILLAGLMILVFALTACQPEPTPEPTLKGSAPEGSLWDGVPEPEGAQYQTDNSVQEGGLHAYYTSDASSGDFVNTYNQQLESSGWTIVNSGGDPFGQFGGGSTATKDTRYLKFNAGGPGGVSYIDICVWPNGEPNDNNCGQNQNNNTLKGAAPPSDDGTSGLLAGIPEPDGATYQATDSIQEGGLHAFWTTSMASGEFVESYNQQLEASGWTIVSSGGDPFGQFGGGSTATQGERYFKFNAGGPGGGTTFIDLCVWPSQPNDNNCGQNQNNNALKGAAPPSEGETGGLLAGVPEPEGATYQATDSIQEGGLHGFYTSNSAPSDVVSAYNSALEANGWTIQNTGGDPFGAFGAGTTATQGGRYLKINAGGPGGVSYIDICVWPAQPNDNNCGQNQNNNALKGAAQPSEGETGGLLAGVPEPEGATYQATDSIQEGGLHGFYTANSAPSDVVSAYNQQLEANGWTIQNTGGDPFGAFGAGTTATQGGRYLKINAGGPGGVSYIDICVWPAQPSDNNCGQNQNNNALKGAAPPSDDSTGGLLAGVPEPEGATYQATDSIQEGGLHAFWTSNQASGEFVSSYNEQLESAGWTIVSTGGDPFGAFGGGSTATYSDGRYLKFNAGGPGGQTFIDICVWAQQPGDNNCGQNQNNNSLRGAAPGSEDAPSGLQAGVPEPEGATYQATDSIQEGGLHAFWTSNQASSEFVSSYNEQLESAGWTIVSTGGDPFGAFGGGSTATYSDGRYLKFNAGGPGGQTFIDICVWPAQPSDDNCGQNQNNNN